MAPTYPYKKCANRVNPTENDPELEFAVCEGKLIPRIANIATHRQEHRFCYEC